MNSEAVAFHKLEVGNKEVLLLKVPQDIAQAWNDACSRSMNCDDVDSDDASRQLGTITLTQQKAEVVAGNGSAGTDASGSVGTLLLPGDLGDVGALERSLLDTTAADDDRPTTILFSYDAGNPAKRPKVEGNIVQNIRCKAQPGQLERFKQSQSTAAVGPVRKVKQATQDFVKSNVAAHRSAQRANAAHAKLVPLAQPGPRKVKLDKEGLEKVLFRCFERQSYWHFKDLIKETQQSAPKLKEALNEVADKIPNGKLKDMYQLKKDYQDVAEGNAG